MSGSQHLCMHSHTYVPAYLQYIHTYRMYLCTYVHTPMHAVCKQLFSVQYWGVASTYTVFVCVPIAYTVYSLYSIFICMQVLQYDVVRMFPASVKN